MTKVYDIIGYLEKFAPAELAEEWDPIGLSFGSYDQKVKKVFVSLDLDPNTLEEAIEAEADLIVTHHPLIFKPVNTLNAEDSKRRLFLKIIQNNLAVFSMHTNVDRVNGGLNDWLANKLQLKDIEVLDIGDEDEKIGYGRIGKFERALPIDEVIKRVKSCYDLDFVRYNENCSDNKYQRIAIVGGSGADFAQVAIEKNADLLITGDISYHEAQDMLRDGLSFIDAGHYIEKIFVEEMTHKLQNWLEEFDDSIAVISATKQKDVFKFK